MRLEIIYIGSKFIQNCEAESNSITFTHLQYYLIHIFFKMRLTQTLPTMAFLFATLIASAPANPKFDYPGSPDELE